MQTNNMTISEEIQPLSDRPARHCAICGARVSDAATTCLICGADLTQQQKEVEEEPQEITSRRLPTIRFIIMVVIAIIVLSGSVVIGLQLNESSSSTELPTLTPTATKLKTMTPTPTLLPTSTPTPIPPTPTPQPPEIYTVQEGDTISGIADEYGLTTDELLAYNELDASDFIVVGQKLTIPPGTPTPGPSPTLRPGEPTATQSPFILHTVIGGDSLSTIAEKYSVNISTIKAANDIPETSDAIQLGQVLTIPMYTPTPEPKTNVVYTITPTPGVMAYEAPLMLYPPNKSLFTGIDNPVILQWSSVGILNNRESYRVEVIFETEIEKTTYTVYTRSTSWRIPGEWIPDNVTELACSWRVHVVRQVTESIESNYKIISSTVARRNFTWVLSE